MIRKTLIKIVATCAIIGVVLGVLAIYHWNISALLSNIMDFFTWIVVSIRDAIAGNEAARQVLTSRPS